MIRACPNKKPGFSMWICLCPYIPFTSRAVLAKNFINGWLNVEEHRHYNRLADDKTTSEEELDRALAEAEYSASSAHGMWEQSL